MEVKNPGVTDRSKRKREKFKAVADGEWTRCMFKLERKARFCNVARVPGSQYCGNHIDLDTGVESNKTKKFKAEMRKRVPCTLDPTHTVYLFDLKKHLVICNKLKDAEAMKQLPYYSLNINSGSSTEKPEEAEETSGKDEENEHSQPTAARQASVFQTLSKMDYNVFAVRLEKAYNELIGSIPTKTLNHEACSKLLTEKQATGAAHGALRHIQQQASILGHMEEKKLLHPSYTYMELGAGRAMLSLALTQLYPASPFILIDRAGTRGKADQYIATESKCTRAKIDIRHLNLSGMQEAVNTPLVCLSKHLCGVATDLSLRALATTLPPNEDKKMSPHLKGFAIALCCHHACNWDDYINPDYFLKMGFTAVEFKLLISLSGWATCGMATEGDAVETVLGWGREKRTTLGRICKRLIDMGRVHYLRDRGMHAELVHYCEQSESLENCLLLAWQPQTSYIQ
ncbi:tRNA guanosine-2'-O-methyltransferase [Thraustotheca clavata]|uniref:tRNA:m(4)X modification enzyme TRM13 n=1 Tax=Thraustotheca clavata TaxID=74557 RepID=A0A1V9ZFQ9_9STRA|nr:tRNA guanosine-2'-O-methyltransferase [Thraustotheca clavata]